MLASRAAGSPIVAVVADDLGNLIHLRESDNQPVGHDLRHVQTKRASRRPNRCRRILELGLPTLKACGRGYSQPEQFLSARVLRPSALVPLVTCEGVSGTEQIAQFRPSEPGHG
jgi:hypothetical protein